MSDDAEHIALTKRLIEHLRFSRNDDENAATMSRVIMAKFKQVAEDEHEACAKIADDILNKVRDQQADDEMEGMYQSGEIAGALAVAAAIRARGKT